MLRRTALFVAVCLLAAAAPLSAQSAMPPMEGMHAFPPPDQLPPPVRMTGIGNSHITIKATPEAQAWFDQGLSLLHDFWDYESARAFEQGIRVDPNCAMCYWGLSQAEGMRGTGTKLYADRRSMRLSASKATPVKPTASTLRRRKPSRSSRMARVPGPLRSTASS